MSIEIEAVCSNPNDVEFKITMTATLKEWKSIELNLIESCEWTPSGKLAKKICHLVEQFENAKYMPKPEETDDAATL